MILSYKLMLETLIISLLACYCHGQSGGMVALTNIETDQQGDSAEFLSKKDLKSIYGVAKNISHSKGPIIKSKEGDFEYRRSFTSKVELEFHSTQLQNVINETKKYITQNSFNKSLLLENLDFLENLVHQYDIGKKFVDIGGFEPILSLTKSKDDDISKAAFLTLSAAMQGNQEVQLYATKTDLLKVISDTLILPLSNQTSSALLALSTFIHNCPVALNAFIKEHGLQTLSNLLDNYYTVQKVQMRIVDMIRDMTIEINDENPDTVSPVLLKIKKTFKQDIEHNYICEKIIEIFFAASEYKTHEKVISAMGIMFNICERKFKERNLYKELDTLLKLYDPFKTLKLWYKPSIDIELRYYLFQDLKELMKKLTQDSVQIKNSARKLLTEL